MPTVRCANNVPVHASDAIAATAARSTTPRLEQWTALDDGTYSGKVHNHARSVLLIDMDHFLLRVILTGPDQTSRISIGIRGTCRRRRLSRLPGFGARYAEGMQIGTSIVIHRNGPLIVTESGSRYILGAYPLVVPAVLDSPSPPAIAYYVCGFSPCLRKRSGVGVSASEAAGRTSAAVFRVRAWRRSGRRGAPSADAVG
jgi:hypothetical protein